ncbi:MAG: hypothetical protein U9N43_06295 [Euryarchaeota archaeon]|nr:hypothetical protein [Euryarchaeota archaeon]
MQKIREYFREQILAQEMNKITELMEEVNRFDARCELVVVRELAPFLVCDRHGKMTSRIAEETAKQIDNSWFRVFTRGVCPSNIVAPWLFGCGVMEFIKQ